MLAVVGALQCGLLVSRPLPTRAPALRMAEVPEEPKVEQLEKVIKRLEEVAVSMPSSASKRPEQKMICLDNAAEIVMSAWFEQQSKHIAYVNDHMRRSACTVQSY